VLRRQLVVTRGHDEAGPADPVGVELLYDNPIEERFQLSTHPAVKITATRSAIRS
jgi:hypothetical protein